MFPSVRFRHTLPPHLPVVLKSVFFAALVICFLAQGCFCAASTDALHRLTSEAGSKSLRIYFVDVEGGQATLFVTPNGQSLLIDTGWPGNKGRDADRILTVAKDAGIRKVDYVLITHFHVDHVGGAPHYRENTSRHFHRSRRQSRSGRGRNGEGLGRISRTGQQ